MTGIEVAVAFLVAWFARKAGRAWKRVDGMADEALDAGLDRLHDVVTAKLGKDSALEVLEAEVVANGEISAGTQDRVRLALEQAASQDTAFAADLEGAIATLRPGSHGIAVGRDVRADSGVSIVMTGGSVTVAPPNPPGPAGSSPRM